MDMKRKGLLCLSGSLLALSAGGAALAQSTGAVPPSIAGEQQESAPASNNPENADTTAQAAADIAQAQEIVVTGVTQGTKKLDATFSINTINAADVTRLAPISTADLLANVPGIYSEGSTAGEASNNITVRGLPVTGGYRYAPQLIDGLPVFEEPEVPFMNNDVFIRADLMTDRVEVVKGGPGGILYSNGLGATVNYVTRTGTQEFKGGYKLEVADYGFVRNDAFISGPINKNLTFAIGGFYRFSDGIRDTGYTADKGGQIRANLVYTSDDHSTVFQAQGLYINDRTAFYQNIPFTVPRVDSPGTAENPIKLDQKTIEPLGIDFGSGTFASKYNRYFTQTGEYGTRDVDFADGIHPKFGIFTLKGSKELDSGWKFSASARYTTGSNGFNGLFTGNDTTTASNFLNVRLQNDVINPAYNAARACDLSNAKLIGYFNVPAGGCQTFASINQQDFVSQYARFSRVAAARTNDGSAVADTDYLNFLIPFIARTDAKSGSLDLQAQKTINLLGEHQLTAGLYGARYDWDVNYQQSLLVSDVGEESHLVDLTLVDRAGNQVGPSLTNEGVIVESLGGFVTNSKSRNLAAYLLDHWETFGGKLKLDFGVRYESRKIDLVRRDRTVITNLTPAGTIVGSIGDTTADDEVALPGADRVFSDTFDAFGWSAGGNYSLTNSFAVYGLVSSSFRLPSLQDANDLGLSNSVVVNGAAVDASPIERIFQLEGGVRYFKREFDASVALFYNNFKPREFVNVYRDFEDPSCAAPGAVVQINQCPEVAERYRRGIRNFGTEVELAWRPDFLEGLELRGNFVVQDPKIRDANYTITQEVRDAANVLTGYRFVTVGEDGRRPRRLPTVMVNVRPSFDFKPTTGIPVSIFAQGFYYGKRYSESTDFNVTQLQSYYIINAGAAVAITENVFAQINVANLTNELSFTESDPVFFDLYSPDGTRNRSLGRPLFGRTFRASLNVSF
jgi:outer membrane receptor protein involved in Fe transport